MTGRRPALPLDPEPDVRVMTGWGRTCATAARVRRVRSVNDVRAAVQEATADPRGRGVLARGLGRSYGDAAQNGGGLLLDMTAVDHLTVDDAAGTATAGAGLSFDSLVRTLVPRGWFVPVTPGTRQITVGGAVAADVHGKNHHGDGTFGAHVRALDLVTADSQVRRLTPGDEPFWTTVAGMGRTGVITAASFSLLPVTSSWMQVETERAEDLDALMAAMADGDAQHRYSVAWIDALAPGRSLGRGVLTRGDHAAATDLPARQRATALDVPRGAVVAPPPWVPGGLVNRWTARAFNTAWFHKAPARRTAELQPLTSFFHPLDAVASWNRVYGPHGLVQYQLAVPHSGADVVRVALERLQACGVPATLGVLKRFGVANPAPLSFPTAGWTLAVDFPADPRLGTVLDDLDERVAAAGGRVYLAKDSRMSPEVFAQMYPRLDEWRSVRDELDPYGVFASDQSRRLLP